MTKYVIELLREPHYLREDLKSIRVWLDGYSVGNNPPLGSDVIRQLQVALDHIKTPQTSDDAVLARAVVIDSMDAVQDAVNKLDSTLRKYNYDVDTTKKSPEPAEPIKSSEYWYTILLRDQYGRSTTWMQLASSEEDARVTFKKNHPDCTILSMELRK